MSLLLRNSITCNAVISAYRKAKIQPFSTNDTLDVCRERGRMASTLLYSDGLQPTSDGPCIAKGPRVKASDSYGHMAHLALFGSKVVYAVYFLK